MSMGCPFAVACCDASTNLLEAPALPPDDARGPADGAAGLSVLVQTIDGGEAFTVPVGPEETVLSLRQRLALRFGAAVRLVSAAEGGGVLQDGSLATQHSTVMCVRCTRGVLRHLPAGGGRPAEAPVLKCLLVGPSGVGKSSFAQLLHASSGGSEHSDWAPPCECVPTSGAEVYPMTIRTSQGPQHLELWDVAGLPDMQLTPGEDADAESLYEGVHMVIYMFSVLDRESYKAMPAWYEQVNREVADNTPQVLVGNKAESPDRTVKPQNIMFHRKKNMEYYDISVLDKDNIEKPCLWLLRRIRNDPFLSIDASTLPRPTTQAQAGD